MGAGPYFVVLSASRIANSNRVDQSGSDDGNVVDWVKANEIILATLISTSKGPIARQYRLHWRNVSDGGSFAQVAHAGGEVEWALDSETVLSDGFFLLLGSKLCSATVGTWQDGSESTEDNILPDGTTYSLADEYYTEFQWGLSLDNALDGKQYEFELYDITEGVVIGTCGAQITTYLPLTEPQTNSRIANSSASWQGACDVDITNWDKANEFILSTYATGGSGSTKQFKLQWKKAGGIFVDVDWIGTVKWGTGTVLVDGNSVANAAGCLTSTVSQENEGDNLTSAITMNSSSVVEIQWALRFDAIAEDDTIYELRLICVTDSTGAVCSCSIRTQAAVEPTISKINGVLDSGISNVSGVVYSGVSKVNGVNTT